MLRIGVSKEFKEIHVLIILKNIKYNLFKHNLND